jgi:hypothetical protein
VKDKSLMRRLIHTANHIISECVEGGLEADEMLAEAESAIMKVGDAQLRSGFSNPRQIVQGFEGGIKAFLDPSKRIHGVSTPFLKFDEMTTGLHAGELIVLAARPAMGKTALALNIAQHVAAELPDKPAQAVAVFSLEMSKESLLTRLLCSSARVDSHRFRGGYLNQDERRRLMQALNQLVESKLYIDDSADANIMDISAKCRRLKARALPIGAPPLISICPAPCEKLYLTVFASCRETENVSSEFPDFQYTESTIHTPKRMSARGQRYGKILGMMLCVCNRKSTPNKISAPPQKIFSRFIVIFSFSIAAHESARENINTQ